MSRSNSESTRSSSSRSSAKSSASDASRSNSSRSRSKGSVRLSHASRSNSGSSKTRSPTTGTPRQGSASRSTAGDSSRALPVGIGAKGPSVHRFNEEVMCVSLWKDVAVCGCASGRVIFCHLDEGVKDSLDTDKGSVIAIAAKDAEEIYFIASNGCHRAVKHEEAESDTSRSTESGSTSKSRSNNRPSQAWAIEAAQCKDVSRCTHFSADDLMVAWSPLATEIFFKSPEHSGTFPVGGRMGEGCAVAIEEQRVFLATDDGAAVMDPKNGSIMLRFGPVHLSAVHVAYGYIVCVHGSGSLSCWSVRSSSMESTTESDEESEKSSLSVRLDCKEVSTYKSNSTYRGAVEWKGGLALLYSDTVAVLEPNSRRGSSGSDTSSGNSARGGPRVASHALPSSAPSTSGGPIACAAVSGGHVHFIFAAPGGVAVAGPTACGRLPSSTSPSLTQCRGASGARAGSAVAVFGGGGLEVWATGDLIGALSKGTTAPQARVRTRPQWRPRLKKAPREPANPFDELLQKLRPPVLNMTKDERLNYRLYYSQFKRDKSIFEKLSSKYLSTTVKPTYLPTRDLHDSVTRLHDVAQGRREEERARLRDKYVRPLAARRALTPAMQEVVNQRVHDESIESLKMCMSDLMDKYVYSAETVYPVLTESEKSEMFSRLYEGYSAGERSLISLSERRKSRKDQPRSPSPRMNGKPNVLTTSGKATCKVQGQAAAGKSAPTSNKKLPPPAISANTGLLKRTPLEAAELGRGSLVGSNDKGQSTVGDRGKPGLHVGAGTQVRRSSPGDPAGGRVAGGRGGYGAIASHGNTELRPAGAGAIAVKRIKHA